MRVFPEFDVKIAIICQKKQPYLDSLRLNSITNAFNIFSSEHDFLSYKKEIDIDQEIYDTIKSNFGKFKPNLVYDNGNYIMVINDIIYTLASCSSNYSDKIKYNRIGIY